ncbi:MAG: hypothetical protein RSC24_06835 [Clostridium sp.]
MEALKLKDYFELRKPTYRYIKITPHKSIRNYTTQSLSKSISATYIGINRRIYKEKRKLIVETEFSIKYVIDIEKGDANFYFIVPNFFLDVCLEKISEIWNKATVEVMEGAIKPFSDNTEMYGMNYKYLDGLSLNVDRKLNEPLNSILRVMEIMKGDDRVTVIYNFMPRTSMGFKDVYEDTIKRFKEKRNVQKPNWNFNYIVLKILDITISAIEGTLSVLNDFLGSGNDDVKIKRDYYLEGLLERKFDDLSPHTKKKKDMNVIDTQIAVVSDGNDYIRRNNNANVVSQAFRSIDGDNELVRKEYKHKIKLEDYSLNTKSSTLSTDELSQLVQIPGRNTLMQLGINYIKTEESRVPKELTEGNKRLGMVKYKGANTMAYLPTEWNIANCGLYLIGGQGSGKTNNIKIYSKDCISAGEGIILLDFIKNCELSNSIAKITPKDKLVEIDLAKQEDIQSFCYNEMKITDKMTTFEKLDKASMQSEQLMSLIDAIGIGDPLSSSMRRTFNSACIITSVLGFNSLKHTIDCLENHKKRQKYINMLTDELKEFLEDEINTLNELNEYSKVNKDNPEQEVIGTKMSKLTFILDRIDLLRSNFKLKYMYKANSDNNIDLLDCMRKGKVVLIKMKDGDFPTQMQKNLLVTYWVTKIWLASQLRGMEEEKPNPRCNLLIDELFQAPSSLKIMEYILPQARKFALKPVLSTHYVKQLDSVFSALLTSNGSFRLLRGCTEEDFKYFKSKLDNYEYEDLRDMPEWHSLDIIYHKEGYSNFISHIPKFK